MIPEIGHFSLILALAFALCLSVVPFVGVATSNQALMRFAKPLTYAMFLCTLLSIVLLGVSFVQDDFSVLYVASHSNSLLPYYFKISAIWGGHEGSILLWVFCLTGWTLSVAAFSKGIEDEFIARVLAIMGLVAVSFIAFTLLTSNPFERLLPNMPIEGRDLNPMLQDFGLIIHPPLLYMGYVGFSVAFAFAIAALLYGKMDAAWARWSRPWTIAAWSFLSVGIALGSWWAYYELGWGGWWMWDPVENASFMPWLVGTALIHSLAVTEKRNAFKNWTILLSILAFSLSLLGTFLVRSGVLTSVHSFATDPSRGVFVLVLLALTVGLSLTLYAVKANAMTSFSRFSLYSRETALLIANIILVIAATTILLGTLYPLLIDALGMGKISVGTPYFNAVFIPIMSLLFIFMGIGPLIRWKKAKKGELRKQLSYISIFSPLFGLSFPLLYAGEFNLLTAMGMTLACWVILVALKDVINQLKDKQGASGLGALSSGAWSIKRLSLSHLGMASAHIGIGITIVGVCLVSIYEIETNVKMSPGSTVEVSGYEIRFNGIKSVKGPNFTAQQGQIEIYKGDTFVSLLKPERRSYTVRTMGMTEAGIDPGLFRDIYVVLGDPLGGGSWAVQIHVKPFIRWVWLGSLFMAFGGCCSIFDKRYRRKSKIQSEKSSDKELLVSWGSNV